MLLTAVSGEGSLSGESTLGSAAADAVRFASGADFSVVNGGELIANLEPRELTYDEISSVFLHDRSVSVTVVTPKDLKELIEHGVSAIVLNERESIDRELSAFDGFPQLSGFELTYDASARPGERVMRITVNGERLDLSDDFTEYTIAASKFMLSGGYGYPELKHTDTGITLADALADYVAAGIPDSYTGKDRITVVGCTDYNIINRVPVAIIPVALVIWVATRLWKFKKEESHNR